MEDIDLWDRAVKARSHGDNREAAELCNQLINRDPPHAGACLLLSKIATERGSYPHAVALASKALELLPTSIDALEQLVTALLLQGGRLSEVDRLLQSVSTVHGHSARFHVLAARALFADGHLRESINAMEAATRCSDATPQIHLAYAEQLLANGHTAQAVARLRTLVEKEKRLRVEKNPTDGEPSSATQLLFDALVSSGHSADAIELFEQSPELRNQLDIALQYRELLQMTGRMQAWIALSRDLAQDAPSPIRQTILAEVLQFEGRPDLAHERIDEAYRSPFHTSKVDIFSHTRLYFDADPALLREFVDRSPWPTTNRPSVATGDLPARVDLTRGELRLRVGYLSADFRDHVMGRMALVMLEHRDRTFQRVHCYSTSAHRDAYTQRFAAACDVFVDCAGLSDEALFARIAQDRLDVLIDLSGPTAGARPYVLARKPAPVIITHVAAGGTLNIDREILKLTDAVADLPENQQYLRERLVAMSGCCYPVPAYPLPTPGVTKAQLGLADRVTLGAFFNYMKLSERCLRLWKSVLDAIPNAVIVFSPLNDHLNVAYQNLMRSAGIPPERYRFLKAGPTLAEQLARYRAIDFVIDSMPYGGVNGTLEALYMGVPVVTLLGTHHCERTSSSMLTHLGVTDTIAHSPSEYVALSRKLASEPAYRHEVSTRIRARWPKFADPADYARRWEALLRKVIH